MTLKQSYDVVVVGAGPAGSMAAKAAAELGAEVLMIEKRQEIGAPVRCAEGAGRNIIKEFITPDPKWIAASLKGARLFSPNGTVFKIGGEQEMGIILERKIFDRELAKLAARAGAHVQVKTSAIGVMMNNGSVCGIAARYLDKELKIASKIVIAADGVESQVARWAGINTALKLKDIETCAQFLMVDIDIEDDCGDFYVGNEVAPGGYIWVFPKGNGEANVGAGIIGSRSGKLRAIDYLQRFVEKKFPDGKIVEMVVGGVPVSGPIERSIGNGIMLAGDAARMADPITGGGITNAMYAGRMAGEVAAKAVHQGDCSTGMLKEYEVRWRALLEKSLARNYRVKEVVGGFTDENLNILAESLKGVNLQSKGFDVRDLVKVLIKRNPVMLFKLTSAFL